MDLNDVIDLYSSTLSTFVTDKVCNNRVCHAVALAQACLTGEELERLSEEADGNYEDPRVVIYYSTLTRIVTAILAKTIQQGNFVREV